MPERKRGVEHAQLRRPNRPREPETSQGSAASASSPGGGLADARPPLPHPSNGSPTAGCEWSRRRRAKTRAAGLAAHSGLGGVHVVRWTQASQASPWSPVLGVRGSAAVALDHWTPRPSWVSTPSGPFLPNLHRAVLRRPPDHSISSTALYPVTEPSDACSSCLY